MITKSSDEQLGVLGHGTPRDRRQAISTKIFVGNLPFETTREELAQLLSAAGSVLDVSLPTNRETGQPRGFAFVAFSTEDQAEEAIRRFNRVEVRGRKLNVNAAQGRPLGAYGPRSATSPIPSEGRGFSGSAARRPERSFKRKGSRRGLRGRKRSL